MVRNDRDTVEDSRTDKVKTHRDLLGNILFKVLTKIGWFCFVFGKMSLNINLHGIMKTTNLMILEDGKSLDMEIAART